MMARRSLLGLLLGAPMVAASRGSNAAGVAHVGISAAPVDPLAGPVRKALTRHRRDLEARVSHVSIPADIDAMKSWSPVFKHSETIKRQKEMRELWDLDEGDVVAIVKHLKSKGYL